MDNLRYLGRLPLLEGEGTDWGILESYADLKDWRESIIDWIVQVDGQRQTPRSAPSPSGEGWGEGQDFKPNKKPVISHGFFHLWPGSYAGAEVRIK